MVYANASRVKYMHFINVATPACRVFTKVAPQDLRQRVARLQKLRGNADRNFGGRIAADGQPHWAMNLIHGVLCETFLYQGAA